MPRYIDASTYEGKCLLCEKKERERGDYKNAARYSFARESVQAEPTADVAPVVHAHWTCVNTTENVYMCDGKDGCGNCTILLEGTPKENDMLFCAHCGARMDEEVNGDA